MLTFDISPVALHNHQPKPKVNIKVHMHFLLWFECQSKPVPELQFQF